MHIPSTTLSLFVAATTLLPGVEGARGPYGINPLTEPFGLFAYIDGSSANAYQLNISNIGPPNAKAPVYGLRGLKLPRSSFFPPPTPAPAPLPAVQNFTAALGEGGTGIFLDGLAAGGLAVRSSGPGTYSPVTFERRQPVVGNGYAVTGRFLPRTQAVFVDDRLSLIPGLAPLEEWKMCRSKYYDFSVLTLLGQFQGMGQASDVFTAPCANVTFQILPAGVRPPQGL